jgi:hypothetical protein
MGFWKDLLITHGHLLSAWEAPVPRREDEASPTPPVCHPPLRLVRLESEEVECPPPAGRSRLKSGPLLGVHGLA